MKLVILGFGGYGQTVYDIAMQNNCYSSIIILDDNIKGKECSTFLSYKAADTEMYPAFGCNELRLDWVNKLVYNNINVANIISSASYISPMTYLGIGVVVLPHAVVNTKCNIGNGVIINSGAIIDHHCVIEDGVHICLGAIVKAENRIPSLMKIDAGCVINNREYPL